MAKLVKIGVLIGIVSIILAVIAKLFTDGTLWTITSAAYIDFAGVSFLGAIAVASHCLICQSKGSS